MTLQDCQVGMVVRRTQPPGDEDALRWYHASHGVGTIFSLDPSGVLIWVRYERPPAGIRRGKPTSTRAADSGVWLTNPKHWEPIGLPTIDEIDEPPFAGVIP
jgi:hypothetical protein